MKPAIGSVDQDEHQGRKVKVIAVSSRFSESFSESDA